MSYLIFLKRLQDSESAAARKAARTSAPYTSVYEHYIQRLAASNAPIPRALETDPKGDTLRWSYWTQLPGEEMLPFVRDTVFQFLRGLSGDTSAFTQYMQDATFIVQKPSLLQEAVKIIDDLHLSEQATDIQGDIYEYLLN